MAAEPISPSMPLHIRIHAEAMFLCVLSVVSFRTFLAVPPIQVVGPHL
jgi:hypothetical protein